MNVPKCVDCWIYFDMMEVAVFIYEGLSLCPKHTKDRRDRLVSDMSYLWDNKDKDS